MLPAGDSPSLANALVVSSRNLTPILPRVLLCATARVLVAEHRPRPGKCRGLRRFAGLIHTFSVLNRTARAAHAAIHVLARIALPSLLRSHAGTVARAVGPPERVPPRRHPPPVISRLRLSRWRAARAEYACACCIVSPGRFFCLPARYAPSRT